MRLTHILPLFACLFVVLPAANAFAATPVEGLWLTENKRSVIEVKDCDGKMCGNVYWIIEGGMQQDSKNPDETKRNAPMCGLQIMWGLEREDDAGKEWEDGKIYKADEGDTYDADIELKDDGTLHLRGYMGLSLFGKSQTWTRVNTADYPRCKPAQ